MEAGGRNARTGPHVGSPWTWYAEGTDVWAESPTFGAQAHARASSNCAAWLKKKMAVYQVYKRPKQ
jgi:hypothetical protein